MLAALARFKVAAVLALLLIPMKSFALTAPITCGQVVGNTTTTANQIDQYTYTATAGQQLSFALWGPSDRSERYSMVADIYTPGGQLITTLVVGYRSIDRGASQLLTMTNGGTYTILVHENGYRLALDYSMSIQSVTGGGCNATAISCGQTVSGTTTSQSEVRAYSYTATAGQQLSFALWGPSDNSGGYSMVADIYTPSGQLITTLVAGIDP